MSKFKNIILIVLVIIISAIPLVTIKNAEFAGVDSQTKEIISSINNNYKPWFKPLWKPPSGEIESLLFALQAAIGAGFIGYFIGLAHGRKNQQK
ncbi:MAG: cobalt ABC transporter substrate-binding protein CbiN [Candidatus Melainabacteria bacterium GWF2_32_7]|nr:MAG: cobalt ABC transporter substrate-binding protein CbiN [Candidatus Melainabacteria bacterium GWF2_32_7]OGI21980.1 MAG: cobalt ABC transporter substrate-binding protein CbiN [Candidatus Melainabacteria bacterium RIFOXYA2_FULL_32_9]